MAAASISVFWDYDTQWGEDRSRNPNGLKKWGEREFDCTEELLELFDSFELRCCFAVVGAAAEPGRRPYHDPEQIRRIHCLGHEVASHSHRHEWLPGLGRKALAETLRRSKQSLEDCIGAEVCGFVPPFNQPFDYPAGFSFSLSERREAGRHRIDLGGLCQTLSETGYRYCRVAYKAMHRRVEDWLTGGRALRAANATTIAGIRCLSLNTPGGFDAPAIRALDYCVRTRGLMSVYGHPHSIHSGNSQDLRHLTKFLGRVRDYQRQGLLQVRTLSEVLS